MFKDKNRYSRTSLTLNIFHTFYSVSIVDVEQVNVKWVSVNNKDTTNVHGRCSIVFIVNFEQVIPTGM